MVGAASPAHAQVEPVQLEGILIEGGTLSGEPTDAATLGSATTVITGEELERRQIRHAADALRTVPGLAVGRTGGVGGFTQVRVRGAEGNQVKVIIDGVEVNSLDFGEFDFATLLATDIKRIEVIRGPQSGIYGANALAGVINISTKKGTQVPKVSAQVEGGSLGTYGVSANASGAGEFGYLSVSAAKRETDGFNIARSGSEDDGSEQKTIFARAGFTPTDDFRIDVMGRYQENDTETDSSDPPVDTPSVISLREQTLARVSANSTRLAERGCIKFSQITSKMIPSAGILFRVFDDPFTNWRAQPVWIPDATASIRPVRTRVAYDHRSWLNRSTRALKGAAMSSSRFLGSLAAPPSRRDGTRDMLPNTKGHLQIDLPYWKYPSRRQGLI